MDQDAMPDFIPFSVPDHAQNSLPPHGTGRKRSPGTLAAGCLHALAAAVLMLSGCASLDLSSLSLSNLDKPKVPTKIVDIWTDTILHQTGQRGVRGFGGRIMFYGTDEKKTIKVDGKLTVYVFDAVEQDTGLAIPEKKFVFPANRWHDHYSHSKLGHSYSVWLPWDEVGGMKRDLVLISRFEAVGAGTVMSDPVRQTLPGIIPPAAVKAKPSGGEQNRAAPAATGPAGEGVRPVSYEAPVGSLAPSAAGQPYAAQCSPAQESSSTVTIDIPANSSVGSAGGVTSAPAPQRNLMPQSPATSDRSASDSGRTPDPGCDPARGTSPSNGSAPPRFLVRRAALVPPWRDPSRTQPLPGSWPSSLPPTPRSDSTSAGKDSNSVAEPKPN
jgi:hypothetical protein